MMVSYGSVLDHQAFVYLHEELDGVVIATGEPSLEASRAVVVYDLLEVLIPALKSIVLDIDLAADRMLVELPEGLT